MATRKPLEIFINPGPSKKPELVRTRIKIKPKMRIPITALTPSSVKRGNRIYLPKRKQVDIRTLNDPIPEEPVGEIKIIQPPEQRFGPNEDVGINEIERKMPIPIYTPWSTNKLSDRYRHSLTNVNNSDPYGISREFGSISTNPALSQLAKLASRLFLQQPSAKEVHLLQQPSAREVHTSPEQRERPKPTDIIALQHRTTYYPDQPLTQSTSLQPNPDPRNHVATTTSPAPPKKTEAPVKSTDERPISADITFTKPLPKPVVDLTPPTSDDSKKAAGLPNPTPDDKASAALSKQQRTPVDPSLEAAKAVAAKKYSGIPPPPVHANAKPVAKPVVEPVVRGQAKARKAVTPLTPLPDTQQPFGPKPNPQLVKGPTDFSIDVGDDITYYFANDTDYVNALMAIDELKKPRTRTRGSGIIDLHLPHLSPAYFSDGGDYFSNGVYQNFF